MEADKPLIEAEKTSPGEDRVVVNHPLFGAGRSMILYMAEDLDLTEPLWDWEATEESMRDLEQMLKDASG